MRIPELLVPVGGKEQLKAAVANGADAVYMSGTAFNARLNADNFKDDELSGAIDFAHEYGVRVHITQNTLVGTDEMPAAVENAVKMYELGADALIIQDRGLAAVLKKVLPDMPLHMSTQGTVYDIAGVKEAVNAGFDRVILSRELSGREMAEICRNSDAEIEVFVHGAICICYSGQCHMSEFIGGRSGNRGACAQPCRLPYELLRNGVNVGTTAPYPLSPADMNLLGHLRELAEAGVASLKIEGRMKSPEYVSIVASEYRKYLDELKAENALGTFVSGKNERAETDRRLRQIFSRGRFTDAYFMGESGKTLMSDEIPKHQGIKIGEIISVDRKRGHAVIKLSGALANGDGIEIRTSAKAASQRGIAEAAAAGGVITYIKEVKNAGDMNLSRNGGKSSGKNGGRTDKNNSKNGRNKNKAGAGDGAGGSLLKKALKGQIVEVGDLPVLLKYPEGIFAPGTSVYKITDAALNSEARASYEKMPQRIGVKFSLTARTGEFAALTASAVKKTDGSVVEVTVCSENILEKANNRPADEESVARQLRKTGGTPYYLEECRAEIKGEPVIPASELNAMRREALRSITEAFTAKRSASGAETGIWRESFKYDIKDHAYGIGSEREDIGKMITVNIQEVDNSEQGTVNRAVEFISVLKNRCGGVEPDMIRLNIPFKAALDMRVIDAAADVGVKISACMPVITKQDSSGRAVVEEEHVKKLIRLCAEGKLYGVSVANPSQLMYFGKNAEEAVRIFFEESMNLYNSYALLAAHACGMSCGVASHELRPDDIITSFTGPVSAGAASYCEVSVWGRVPLMHLEHCPVGSTHPRSTDSPFTGAAAQRSALAAGFCSAKNKKHYCRAGNHSLRDRKGELFPLVPDDRTCRCTVMSHRPIDFTDRIADLTRAGIKNFRFNVFDESAEEIINMIEHLFG